MTTKKTPKTPNNPVKRILLSCEGYEPVAFSARPRFFHAPIHVSHAIGKASFVVDPIDPRERLDLNGTPLDRGGVSKPVRLAYGRNRFTMTVTAADRRTKREYYCKVFRDYPQPEWKRVAATAPWQARDSAGELVFRGRMWLLGGYIPSLANDVWSSADGLKWRRGGDIPTARGVDIPIAFVFRNKMWVADVDGVLFSSPDGETWTVATDKAPWRGRASAGCAVFKGKIWVMGGAKEGKPLNDVWSSPDGIHWTLEHRHAPWTARQITHTPVVLNGRMWLLGGGALGKDYYPSVAWNDVWSTADGKHWERVLSHAPWVPRIWGSTAVYAGRMWLLGGFRAEPTWENLGDVWYSTDGADWRRLDTAPSIRHSGEGKGLVVQSDSIWQPRHEHSVYAHDGSLWVAAGMIWPLMNDVWRLTISGLCFVTQPVIEIYADTRYEYAARADFNQSRRSVLYRLKRGPKWLSVDRKTGVLSGTAAKAGDFSVCVEAYDARRETARQEYTLHVIASLR